MTVALVTGACSGIGLEMARLLAARGHRLVLVSHRPGPLAEVAERLGAEHGVEAIPLAMDLGRPEAAGELFDAVSARGIEVEVLVNNAGMFFFGEVADADPRAGIEAMFRGDAECVPGALTQAMAAAASVTPQAVVDWLRRRAPWLPKPG